MKNKKEIFGWAMFDFANSAYTTNITTVIFSIYFINKVCEGESVGNFYWGLGGSFSNILIILTAPTLGAIADFSRCRKKFLTITCLTCVVTTALLFFVQPGMILFGLFLFVISNYFFQISESLCSSFLPNLAEPEELGKISGFGWGLGYLGGVTGLLLCKPILDGAFGDDTILNVRLTNLVTAGLFLVAAVPTFLFLKEHGSISEKPPGASYIGIGFSRVKETLTHLRSLYDLSVFLGVFTLMCVSLTIIIAFSAPFAENVIGFETSDLMILFIVSNLSGAIGAIAFGFIQDRIGIRKSLQILLVIWVLTLTAVYFTKEIQIFWVLAAIMGAGLGSLQSAGRGMVALMAPKSKSGEIFGFWSLTYKLGGIVGLPLYGFLAYKIGHRPSMLFVAGFFVLALIGLRWVDEKRGHEAALDFERKFGATNASVETSSDSGV